MGGKIIDLTGKTFGKLTVANFSHLDKTSHAIWLCRCNCGKEKLLYGTNLKSGVTKDCGCNRKKRHTKTINKGVYKKNGLSRHPLYRVLSGMKSRCYNKKIQQYKHYGGRGITVCDEWKNDFKKFYDWAIINGWQRNLTIDRIDNNGNYEPLNCRWTTQKKQLNNTRQNRFIRYNNETKTLSEWCELLQLNYFTISSRVRNSKWSAEKAFETPIKKIKSA